MGKSGQGRKSAIGFGFALGFAWALAVGAGCAGGEKTPDLRAEMSEVRGVSGLDGPGLAHRPDADALAERVAFGAQGRTKLQPAYVLRRLREREAGSAVNGAFAAVLAGDTPAGRAALYRALELEFVHRADTSSLDLLGAELSERFRTFDWQAEDYPGGEEGPNEMYAGTLADALDGVTPERRANRAEVAVILREEATEAVWGYVLDQWRAVPGEFRGDQGGEPWKLNRHALGPYVAMRAAAAADGVDLTILSGHRDPARAAANAARVGNSFAVASFSSHSLGLAIDFALPRPPEDVLEDAADDPAGASGLGEAGEAGGGVVVEDRFRLTTRPMSAVVDMRRSPVHKWLHLYGERFGWYPFQHEPWHWEYNPPGFRAVFFGDFAGGLPVREPGGAGAD